MGPGHSRRFNGGVPGKGREWVKPSSQRDVGSILGSDDLKGKWDVRLCGTMGCGMGCGIFVDALLDARPREPGLADLKWGMIATLTQSLQVKTQSPRSSHV